jgi:hypothetical protein
MIGRMKGPSTALAVALVGVSLARIQARARARARSSAIDGGGEGDADVGQGLGGDGDQAVALEAEAELAAEHRATGEALDEADAADAAAEVVADLLEVLEAAARGEQREVLGEQLARAAGRDGAGLDTAGDLEAGAPDPQGHAGVAIPHRVDGAELGREGGVGPPRLRRGGPGDVPLQTHRRTLGHLALTAKRRAAATWRREGRGLVAEQRESHCEDREAPTCPAHFKTHIAGIRGHREAVKRRSGVGSQTRIGRTRPGPRRAIGSEQEHDGRAGGEHQDDQDDQAGRGAGERGEDLSRRPGDERGGGRGGPGAVDVDREQEVAGAAAFVLAGLALAAQAQGAAVGEVGGEAQVDGVAGVEAGADAAGVTAEGGQLLGDLDEVAARVAAGGAGDADLGAEVTAAGSAAVGLEDAAELAHAGGSVAELRAAAATS